MDPSHFADFAGEKRTNALDLVFLQAAGCGEPGADAKNYVVKLPLAGRAKSMQRHQLHVRTFAGDFAALIPTGTDFTLQVSGIKDKSAAGNVMAPPPCPSMLRTWLEISSPLNFRPRVSRPKQQDLLPQKNECLDYECSGQPDRAPDDRIIIAGFGLDEDNSDGGTSRYFAVIDNASAFGPPIKMSSPAHCSKRPLADVTKATMAAH